MSGLFDTISPSDVLSGVGTLADIVKGIVDLLGGDYKETVPGSGCFKKEPGIPGIYVDHSAPAVDVTFGDAGTCDPDKVNPNLEEPAKETDDSSEKVSNCPAGEKGICVRISVAVSDTEGWALSDKAGVRTIDICNLVTGAGGKISQGPCRHLKLNDDQIKRSTEGQIMLVEHLCVPRVNAGGCPVIRRK